MSQLSDTFFAPEGITWEEWLFDEVSYGGGSSGYEVYDAYSFWEARDWVSSTIVCCWYNFGTWDYGEFDSESEAEAFANQYTSATSDLYRSPVIYYSDEICDGTNYTWSMCNVSYQPEIYDCGDGWWTVYVNYDYTYKLY